MTSKLGLHWLREHPDNDRDLAHVERMRYRSIKLFKPAWDNRDFCRDLLTVLPHDAYILARDHDLSEQKQDMWGDAKAAGINHAYQWIDKVKRGLYHMPLDRTFFLGINEPDATHGDRDKIDRYTEAFLRTLQNNGLRGGAFNFSTGHPRTVDGTRNTPADYTVFERSHRAIVEGHHIGVLHIYGTGAVPLAPGHYDRLQACAWTDVEWVVGEFAVDEHVIGGGAHAGFHQYFNGRLNDYCDWLDTAILGINDPRIHSYQVFTHDFSHPWDSFDIRPIRDALETYTWRHMSVAATTPPQTVHIPAVIAPGPTPPPQEAVPTGDNWARTIDFVLRMEGGLSTDPNDPGNYVNGKFVGTNFGISAAAHPNVDIVNLTKEQAKQIYFNSYWIPSGASSMQWPLCLAVMDLAVNGGVGRAREALNEAGHDFVRFMAWRIAWYTRIQNFERYGRAWIRRCAELMNEASK